MAAIGSTWAGNTWISSGGWAANTWANAQEPAEPGADICLTATRSSLVELDATTTHARECEGDTMCSLAQTVNLPPGSVQMWEFTMSADIVPQSGIGAWDIEVNFARRTGGTVLHTEAATVTNGGSAGVTDATFTITLDSDDLTDYTFGDEWAWTCWRTDTGEEEVLASGTLPALNVVPIS